jgi:16S rRNA (cytidine1402-2'-O)-methyltransferase
MTGKLILVATPIGNLGDLSHRAMETLEQVDFIAAEDTRVSIKILNHLGIKKPMVSYYEHNRRERGEEIVARIEAGETCALVTDAGMPAISDPGEDLVALCVERGISVSVIPGACAAVSALAVSGLPTCRFTFEGFLSINKRSRAEHLELISNEKRTMIFYEAPHKIRSTLTDMLSTLGDRRITLVRELTKMYEEIIYTTLSEAVKLYEDKSPRGEYVLIIEGAKEETKTQSNDDLENALTLVQKYEESGSSTSEAIKMAVEETGIKKSQLYNIIMQRKNEK